MSDTSCTLSQIPMTGLRGRSCCDDAPARMCSKRSSLERPGNPCILCLRFQIEVAPLERSSCSTKIVADENMLGLDMYVGQKRNSSTQCSGQ
eukprot:954949-Amphidinium_carterae.1